MLNKMANAKAPEKKSLIIFFLITYGITFLMAFPMGYFFFAGKDITVFIAAQVLYPASGVILGRLFCEKHRSALPFKFFLGFLTLTAVMILWCFSLFFISDFSATTGSRYSTIIGSIILWILYFLEPNETREKHSLNGHNWYLCIQILGLFFLLFFARSLLTHIIARDFSSWLNNISFFNVYILLISNCISIFLFFPRYFGEEYGWRYFLQPHLQQKVGAIKGVLILGFLWEAWHFPAVLFYYAPISLNDWVAVAQCVLVRYASTTGLAIFLCYAYTRTNNIWLVSLIHMFHNSFGIFLAEITSSWIVIFSRIIADIAIFYPLLLTKPFKKTSCFSHPNKKI